MHRTVHANITSGALQRSEKPSAPPAVPSEFFWICRVPKSGWENSPEGNAYCVRARFTITTREILGDENLASTTYSEFANDVRPGDRVLLNDER